MNKRIGFLLPALLLAALANPAKADVVQGSITGAGAETDFLSNAETIVQADQGALSIGPLDIAGQSGEISSESTSVLFGASSTDGFVTQTTEVPDGVYAIQTTNTGSTGAIGLSGAVSFVDGEQSLGVVNVDGLGSVGLAETSGGLLTASGTVLGASESTATITQVAQTPDSAAVQSSVAGTTSLAAGPNAEAGTLIVAEQGQQLTNDSSVQLSTGSVTTAAIAGPGNNVAGSGGSLVTTQVSSF